ncbi:FAD-binding monooxygenase [Oricola sp.]|uniref:FAD-binding monooxygenase n=1 Tax=Oricola sp. TaxID=1979950 RepID=UPI002600D514|nr:FAD-binding monooxygenase [Oricola sp.]MCI5077777.1 FAD-binding monooxygenase [Oricola sp.]
MQFHLNGFTVGDPEIAPETEDKSMLASTDTLPEEVDVLIAGCGPAGLALAAQLSKFPEIKTRIVEQKPAALTHGQADGIACRTMEMFNAFGFAGKIAKEACWISEVTFWTPDSADPSTIKRSDRVQDVEDDLSEFPHVVLNQARVHDAWLEVMANSPNRLVPNYSRRLADVKVDTGPSAGDHPVTVTVERIDDEHKGQIETVKAKYVVGCDGARSAVRAAMGRTLEGDAAHQAWGVMDILASTDFPDVRMKSVIQSADEGTILLIPREGGHLFRVYVELDKLAADERVASKNITVDYLINASNRILSPYSFDVKEVAWWSVYEIGHRITDKFDDVPEAEMDSRLPHVFIAGDACHTHSPKMGQGMNVSMQDAFNLGWKLAYVLQGKSGPELLHSYSAERKAIAQDLIDFDSRWARMLSAPRKSADNPDGVEAADISKHFVQLGRYTAGVATVYQPSVLTGNSDHQTLAQGLRIGSRFHSAPVIRLGDAKPVQLAHAVEADGRWRIFAFSGAEDPAAETSGIRALCDFLSRSPDSPVLKYTPADADLDAVIDVRAVFQQNFRDVELGEMPSLLLPKKGRYGLTDYEKMFCADTKSGDDVYDMRGIDRAKGCIVIVRPDQYIAHVLPLDAHMELAAFFDGFLLPAAGEAEQRLAV